MDTEKEIKGKHPHWDLHDTYAQKLICEPFEKRLKELGHQRLMNPPEEIWVMEKGHPQETKMTGPYYRHHQSYFCCWREKSLQCGVLF
jgi:hypothetical protein